jgi:hypothetical protein
LTLNGAPVAGSANFDLGVPGYRYDLNADLQSVPVKPLAQSVLHGQLVDLQGTMSGQMKFTGIGATGADLREHLRGTMSFAATNLDHRVTGTQQPWIQALFGTLVSVLRLPNISQSPIDGIATELQAGQGVLNVKSARINSAACIIEAQGQMRFADILTNSPINFPIRVSIPKSGRFESLPQFLTLGGTLTAPQPELNPLGVAQLATQLPGSAGGLVNQGVGQLGGILDKALGQAGATNLGVGTSLLKGFLDGARTNGASNANSTRPASDQKKSNP